MRRILFGVVALMLLVVAVVSAANFVERVYIIENTLETYFQQVHNEQVAGPQWAQNWQTYLTPVSDVRRWEDYTVLEFRAYRLRNVCLAIEEQGELYREHCGIWGEEQEATALPAVEPTVEPVVVHSRASCGTTNSNGRASCN